MSSIRRYGRGGWLWDALPLASCSWPSSPIANSLLTGEKLLSLRDCIPRIWGGSQRGIPYRLVQEVSFRVKPACPGVVRGCVKRTKIAEASKLGKCRHKKVVWFSQTSTRKKHFATDMRPFGQHARASTATSGFSGLLCLPQDLCVLIGFPLFVQIQELSKSLVKELGLQSLRATK